MRIRKCLRVKIKGIADRANPCRNRFDLATIGTYEPKISVEGARKAICTGKDDHAKGIVPKLFPHQIVAVYDMIKKEEDPR